MSALNLVPQANVEANVAIKRPKKDKVGDILGLTGYTLFVKENRNRK